MNRRTVQRYRQLIRAEPDVVFPLLCPVREREWLDGWSCEVLYSASGLVEPGCVFSTPGVAEPDTVWVVSAHDPRACTLQFVRFTPGLHTCVLDLSVHAAENGASHVDVCYTYTSLSEAGDRYLDSLTEESFLAAVRFWERSVNHWLETGKALPRT